jgi:hypothetical protein
MPDWRQIARKNLRVLGVCSPEFTEELAAHLEDSYEASLCEGVPAAVAFQHTIGQIEGRCRVWLVMRFLLEDLMAGITREVVLSGLLTSAAAGFFYWMLALDPLRHKVIWLVGGQLPLWWWCLLPICGALGAILSRRKRGSRLQRIAASLIPSGIMGIFILLLFVVGFTLSGFVNHYWWVYARLESMGLVPPGFVVIPGAFSLLGAGIAEVSTKKLCRLA